MNANRRGFLQMFGAGAVIAPLVGGLVDASSPTARIIEPPKIEIIPAPELVQATSPPAGKCKIVVDIIEESTGNHYHFNAQSFATSSCVVSMDGSPRTTRDIVTGSFRWKHSMELTSQAMLCYRKVPINSASS